MLTGMVPVSSLKRDEIYTFIAGLSVAAAWFININSGKGISTDDDTLYKSCIFILIWLASTTSVFLMQLLLSSIMRSTLIKHCALMSDLDLRLVLDISLEGRVCFPAEYFKEQVLYNHILGVCINSTLLSAWPIINLQSLQNDLWKVCCWYFGVMICLLYFNHKFWSRYASYFTLKNRGQIDVYDEKKYSEEISVSIALKNIAVTEANFRANQINSVISNTNVIEYNHYVDFESACDVDMSWKWFACVKIMNAIDNLKVLQEHALVEYCLYDSEMYLLECSSVMFNDFPKISHAMSNEDKANSDGDLVLSFKQISKMSAERSKFIAFSNCRIRYVATAVP